MNNNKKVFEKAVHGIFLILGLVTIGCVLMITVYLNPRHKGNRAVKVFIWEEMGVRFIRPVLWDTSFYPDKCIWDSRCYCGRRACWFFYSGIFV